MFSKQNGIRVFVLLALAATTAAAQAKKEWKDQAEYDLYNAVLKAATTAPKQIELLSDWSRKYPDSDYKDDRTLLFVQAYGAANEPGKALEAAEGLMSRGLDSVFKDPRQVLTVLYMAAFNLQKIRNPSPEQVSAGVNAARKLSETTPVFFTAANKPAQTSEADWAKARADMEAVAKSAMIYGAMAPGQRELASNSKDPANCAKAESAFLEALKQHPDSGQISYALASALRCQQATRPEKVPLAIYQYARAAGLQPGLDDYLRTIYTQYHGSTEGLEELRKLAAGSPLPPADFKLKSKAEIEQEREAEIAKKNPQLALWAGIKQHLEDPAYFDASLKDAAVPKLRGTLVEARPACRPKELLVAISDATTPEVTLKFETALGGKPAAGSEIQWEGVPTAFVRSPFMLTMNVEKTAVENLKLSPCAKK